MAIWFLHKELVDKQIKAMRLKGEKESKNTNQNKSQKKERFPGS